MVKETGISFIDSLEPQVRQTYIKNARHWWQSLSPEQKLEQLEHLHKQAAIKIKENGGMLTHKDALLLFLNRDVKMQIEKILMDMEVNARDWDIEAEKSGVSAYHDIAQFLRDRRQAYEKFGLDALNFDIHLTDDPQQVGVTITTTTREERD